MEGLFVGIRFGLQFEMELQRATGNEQWATGKWQTAHGKLQEEFVNGIRQVSFEAKLQMRFHYVWPKARAGQKRLGPS